MRNPDKWQRPALHIPRRQPNIGPALVAVTVVLILIAAAIGAFVT